MVEKFLQLGCGVRTEAVFIFHWNCVEMKGGGSYGIESVLSELAQSPCWSFLLVRDCNLCTSVGFPFSYYFRQSIVQSTTALTSSLDRHCFFEKYLEMKSIRRRFYNQTRILFSRVRLTFANFSAFCPTGACKTQSLLQSHRCDDYCGET